MRKGYVKDGHWYDKYDQPHFIQNMEDRYLENVVKLLDGRMKARKEKLTEDQLKTDEKFIQDFKSLLAIAQEQEHRISVNQTNMGQLLYK